jgi:outer membrane lipoprotein-sorting protein
MNRHAILLIASLAGCGAKPVDPRPPAEAGDPLDPASFRQYSSLVTVESGGQTHSYEYTREGSKLRIVPILPDGKSAADQVAILVDEDQRTATVLSIPTRQYTVRPVVDSPEMAVGQRRAVVSRERLGSETVSGHACTLHRLVTKPSNGAERTMKVWSAPELGGFPLKIESDRAGVPTTTTFSNVRVGALHDPSLFTIPSGFTKAGT